MRIVQKYGGSSVATIEQIKSIAKHIKEIRDCGNEVVVVASAMGKTTDALISTVKEISSAPNKRELDALLSTGESKTVSLLAIALNEIGVPAISLSGWQAGFRTTDDFSRAFIIDLDTTKIEKELKEGKIVVVAGFQGITENKDITTLGRGGSDTTAVALASKLGAICEIYTDVECVHTIDPRIYPNAKKLHQISFEEMMESAVGGAKVLETRCVELAKKYNVKLYLGKTLEKNKKKGTFVMNNPSYFEEMPITNLSVKETGIISIKGKNKSVLNEVFNEIIEAKINFEMLSLSEINGEFIISFSAGIGEIIKISENLNKKPFFKDLKIEIKENACKIMLVGLGFSTHTRIAGRVFETLIENNIDFSKISVTEISISFVVDLKDKQKTIEVLASKFGL